MKKIVITSALLVSIFTMGQAQEKVWTLDECMEYAIENSPKVKIKKYESDNYKADFIEVIGNVMPSITPETQMSWGYGRNINPEDNTYNNYSTFNNQYYVGTSIPIFAGGYHINNWKMAKANRQLGKSNEQLEKDNLAMTIMQDYVDVVYYKGMIEMAAEKLDASRLTFYKTQRMQELGLKSIAEVAQTEALMADDDYALTNYTNLYNTAVLKLKQDMYYPIEDNLNVEELNDTNNYLPELESSGMIYEYARFNNPQALSAELSLKSYQYQYRKMKANFLPSISFSASVSTNYIDVLSLETKPVRFSKQFRDNMGEGFAFNIRVPLISVSNYTNARRARNNVRIAAEQQKETLREIQKAIEQNVMDREGYAKEIIQMEKQVNSNDLSYQLTLRQYEEGIMSPIEVQVSSNALILSKANLLQKRLLYVIKDRIVNYYKGIPLVEEK